MAKANVYVNKLEINGKEYEIPQALKCSQVIHLEELGVSPLTFEKSPFKTAMFIAMEITGLDYETILKGFDEMKSVGEIINALTNCYISFLA